MPRAACHPPSARSRRTEEHGGARADHHGDADHDPRRGPVDLVGRDDRRVAERRHVADPLGEPEESAELAEQDREEQRRPTPSPIDMRGSTANASAATATTTRPAGSCASPASATIDMRSPASVAVLSPMNAPSTANASTPTTATAPIEQVRPEPAEARHRCREHDLCGAARFVLAGTDDRLHARRSAASTPTKPKRPVVKRSIIVPWRSGPASDASTWPMVSDAAAPSEVFDEIGDGLADGSEEQPEQRTADDPADDRVARAAARRGRPGPRAIGARGCDPPVRARRSSRGRGSTAATPTRRRGRRRPRGRAAAASAFWCVYGATAWPQPMGLSQLHQPASMLRPSGCTVPVASPIARRA